MRSEEAHYIDGKSRFLLSQLSGTLPVLLHPEIRFCAGGQGMM